MSELLQFVYEWFIFNAFSTDYNIMEKLNEGYLTTFRDEQTMTEVAYSEKGLVSYDDERAICDKTEYAMVHNLVRTSSTVLASRLLLLNILFQSLSRTVTSFGSSAET